MLIELIAKQDYAPHTYRPYDFEIRPENGVLSGFCATCETNLVEEEQWMEHAILNAMRISLFLYERVRIIHCGRCGDACCGADTLKKWLVKHGPLQITDTPFQINKSVYPIGFG